MQYILKDGDTYTKISEDNIKKRFPNVMGAVGNYIFLAEHNIYPLSEENKPDDVIGKVWELDATPTSFNNPFYVLAWTQRFCTADEARELRNKLLTETDWTGNSDVVMSDEMTAYRQSLRDLPAVTDFPAVTYPTKP
jgi:hypothetical protein